MIKLKNKDQIAKMRTAGHMLYDVLCLLKESVQVGITTKDLDKIAEEAIRKQNAIPSFLNYGGFPASICASVDEEVVHGIPSHNIELKEGQILSIDCGLILDGWQADSALTVPVGNVSQEILQLVKETENSFWAGYRAAVSGARIGDIGAAVQAHAEKFGYGVVRDLTGHGIGRDMHEDPSVPNYGTQGHGVRLREGMAICIEPMIALGTWKVHQLADGWTIVTNDHKPCSHYEHTIAITKEGLPEVLTLPDGGIKGVTP